MSKFWNKINRYKLSVSSISQFDLSASNSDDDSPSLFNAQSPPSPSTGRDDIESVVPDAVDEEITTPPQEIPIDEAPQDPVPEEHQSSSDDVADASVDTPSLQSSDGEQHDSEPDELESSASSVRKEVDNSVVSDEPAQDSVHEVERSASSSPITESISSESNHAPPDPRFRPYEDDSHTDEISASEHYEEESASDRSEVGERRLSSDDVHNSDSGSPRESRGEGTQEDSYRGANFSTLDQVSIDALINQPPCYDALINTPGSYSSCIETSEVSYAATSTRGKQIYRPVDIGELTYPLSSQSGFAVPSEGESEIIPSSVSFSAPMNVQSNIRGSNISSGRGGGSRRSATGSRVATSSHIARTHAGPTTGVSVYQDTSEQNVEPTFSPRSYDEVCNNIARMMIKLGETNQPKVTYMSRPPAPPTPPPRQTPQVHGTQTAESNNKSIIAALNSEYAAFLSSKMRDIDEAIRRKSSDGSRHSIRQQHSSKVRHEEETPPPAPPMLHSREKRSYSHKTAHPDRYGTKQTDSSSEENHLIARVGENLLINRLAKEVEYYKQLNSNLETKISKIWNQHEALRMVNDRLAESVVWNSGQKTVRFEPDDFTDCKDNGDIVDKDTDILIGIESPKGGNEAPAVRQKVAETAPRVVADQASSPSHPYRTISITDVDHRVPRGIRCNRRTMERVLSSGTKLHALKLTNTGSRLQTQLYVNVLSPQNSHSDRVVLSNDIGLFKLSLVNPPDSYAASMDLSTSSHAPDIIQQTRGPFSALINTIAGCVGLPWQDGQLSRSGGNDPRRDYGPQRSHHGYHHPTESYVQIRYMHSLVQTEGRLSMINDSFLSCCNIAALFSGRHEQLFCVESTQNLSKLDMEGNPKFTFILVPSSSKGGSRHRGTKKFKGHVKILNSSTRHYLCIDLLTHELLFDDNRSTRPYSKYVVPAYFKIVPLYKLLMETVEDTTLEVAKPYASTR